MRVTPAAHNDAVPRDTEIVECISQVSGYCEDPERCPQTMDAAREFVAHWNRGNTAWVYRLEGEEREQRTFRFEEDNGN